MHSQLLLSKVSHTFKLRWLEEPSLQILFQFPQQQQALNDLGLNHQQPTDNLLINVDTLCQDFKEKKKKKLSKYNAMPVCQ